jgi:lysophospholipase L1-like esterase
MSKQKKEVLQRRNLLKAAALTPLGIIGIPEILKASPGQPGDAAIPKGTTILFQGDSITDAGRNRSHYYPNNPQGMGGGYVYQIVADIMAHHPADQIKCYNRGISGNKVHQLAARWEDDCLQLKPQVLSILIGVNDFWHTLSSGYQGTPEIFNKDLRELLNRTQQAIPGVKIIMGEPFAVKGGTAITEKWKSGFPPYQQMVKEIADDFNTTFVPYQQIFDQALDKAPVDHWCPDGVHPSMAGAFLMKEAWLEAFHKII